MNAWIATIALGLAAAPAAAIQVALEEHVEQATFEVQGATAQALAASIAERGPMAPWGGAWPATPRATCRGRCACCRRRRAAG